MLQPKNHEYYFPSNCYFNLLLTENINYESHFKNNSSNFLTKYLDNYQPYNIESKFLINIDNYKALIDTTYVEKYFLEKDENKVDKLSFKLYDNSEFYWLILLLNDIRNPLDWYMCNDDLREFTTYLFETCGYNNIYSTWQVLYELMMEYNEKKRDIYIVRKEALVTTLDDLYKKLGR